MNSFRLTISAPAGHVFNGEATMLTLRGAEGELAIMAGHVPFITSVRPCNCKVVTEDGERIGHTDGGLLTVSAEGATLLSGSFRWQDEN